MIIVTYIWVWVRDKGGGGGGGCLDKNKHMHAQISKFDRIRSPGNCWPPKIKFFKNDKASLLVVLLSGPSSAASLSSSRVRLHAFHALSLRGLSHLTTHFVAGLLLPSVLFHRAFQPLKPVCQTPVWP